MDETIVKFDARELEQITKQYLDRGGNLAEINPVIAESLLERVIGNFETESGFEQGPWKEMADATKDARRRKGSSSFTLLRDTGVLFGSLTAWSDDEAAEAYTNNPNAKWHVSPEPRQHLPLRDFTDIDFDEVSNEAGELMLAEVLT